MPTHANINHLTSSFTPGLKSGGEKTEGRSFSFYALLVFVFINYTAPQAHFPFLIPLRLAMTFIVITGIAHVKNSKKKGLAVIQYDKETKYIIYMLLLALASIPFSMWPSGSFTVFNEKYIKAVILFLLIANILKSSDQMKVMLLSVVIFCFYIAKIGIGNYFAGNFVRESNRISGMLSQMASNPNDIAMTLSLAIPFAVSLFIICKKKISKIICLIYVFIAFYCVILTFSRGGFLTIVTVLSVYFFKKMKGSPVKGILFGTVSVIILLSVMPSAYTQRLATIFEPDTESSSKIRKEVMLASIEIMVENPLLGAGLGMNELALNDMGFYWETVHSVFLEMGSDIGVPALLIFISLLIKLIKNMRLIQQNSKSSESKDLFYLAEALEVSLLTFIVGGFFLPIAYHFYFYYLAGFAVALNRISNNTNAIQTVHPS